MTQPAAPVFFLRFSGQGGLRSRDIVALEGVRRLGFRLIGRGSDRQPVHALATTSYSLAQHSDIFQNGEDRSLAVVPEPDHRGAYRSAACFLAVGMADMNLKKREVVEPLRS